MSTTTALWPDPVRPSAYPVVLKNGARVAVMLDIIFGSELRKAAPMPSVSELSNQETENRLEELRYRIGPRRPRTKMILSLWATWGLVALGYLLALQMHRAHGLLSAEWERGQQSFSDQAAVEPD